MQKLWTPKYGKLESSAHNEWPSYMHTDSKIQYTGCLHAAMEMSGTVTCETFNKGFNTHSGQTTSTRRTKGNSQPHNYGGRIWTLTF